MNIACCSFEFTYFTLLGKPSQKKPAPSSTSTKKNPSAIKRKPVSKAQSKLKPGKKKANGIAIKRKGNQPKSNSISRDKGRTSESVLLSRKPRNRREIEANLKLLEKQVSEYREKIKAATESETESVMAMENLSRQIEVYRVIINEQEDNLHAIATEIEKQQTELAKLELNLKKLQDDYARYAVGIYKYGQRSNTELLFSASSLNQGLIRSEYIRQFQQAGKLKLKDIEQRKNEIALVKQGLNERYAENARVLKSKKDQASSMENAKQDREKLIGKLRLDKTRFQTEIQRAEEKRRNLQVEIQRLIEREIAEREKREREEKERRESALAGNPNKEEGRKIPEADYTFPEGSDIARLQGKLPWPVRAGVVIREYGQIENKELKTVSFNNGVDISVSKGSAVYAVAGGVVTLISYLPTFGNIVLIRHPSSFITVYANVEEIKVAKGEQVNGGTLIGTAGDSPEGGALVHFEVWRGKEKVDPERWLVKR
ncbi:MAG: peptidoglycan DD-metalloendopeptidase family protein [Chloroherpetonaceae bacterium]|nr:peptidoglycan DD-metalloendopeptidase family protein [Chloroherpetonaceae bacterium]